MPVRVQPSQEWEGEACGIKEQIALNDLEQGSMLLRNCKDSE